MATMRTTVRADDRHSGHVIWARTPSRQTTATVAVASLDFKHRRILFGKGQGPDLRHVPGLKPCEVDSARKTVGVKAGAVHACRQRFIDENRHSFSKGVVDGKSRSDGPVQRKLQRIGQAVSSEV